MEINTLKHKVPHLNYPIIILSIVTGVLIGSLYVYVAIPLYNSTAKIVSPVANNQQPTVTIFDAPESVYTEEIKNAGFLTKALENNPGLITTFEECDFRTTPAEYSFPYEIKYTTQGNKSFQPQQYIIEETGPNSFILHSNTHSLMRTKSGNYGTEVIDNNLALTITKKSKTPYRQSGLITEPEHHFKIHSAASKAEELLASDSKLSVTDKNGILKINVREEHPAAAASIANAIAEYYLKEKTGITESGNNATNSIETIAAQIAATEKEISKYKREHHLTEITADTEKNLSMSSELQLQKTQLEIQLAALDNLTLYLRKNREVNNSQVEYGVVSDPSFTENISKLNQLYETKSYGEANAKTDQEIENLKILISERILNTRKKTAIQIDKINEAIATTQNNISRLPEQANTLLALERKMQLDKKVYDLLIEKKAASIVNGTTSVTNTKIITTATRSISPVWPAAYLVITFGAFAGLFAGVVVSTIIASFRRNKIHNRAEVSEVTKLPFIATIGESGHQQLRSTTAVNDLCTAVLMKPDVKLITITSSNEGEGKTFIATQLAQALAAIDKKVLLLDMNLANPAIAAKYGITTDKTLAEVLSGQCDIHDAICLSSYPNLEVLSPGELLSGVNTLLSSGKKDEVLSVLKKHYDFIIVDTINASTSIDAVAMMKLSDLNLFVVRANTTRKSSLITVERIRSDYNIDSIFLVLNNITENYNSSTLSKRRNRPININRTRQPKQAFVPKVLKKIALWFY